jgi:hypothetical protein
VDAQFWIKIYHYPSATGRPQLVVHKTIIDMKEGKRNNGFQILTTKKASEKVYATVTAFLKGRPRWFPSINRQSVMGKVTIMVGTFLDDFQIPLLKRHQKGSQWDAQ